MCSHSFKHILFPFIDLHIFLNSAALLKMAAKDEYRNVNLEEKIAEYVDGTLNLSEMALTNQDMSIIIQQGIREKQCTYLDLGDNKITLGGVRILVEELKTNTTLIALYLNYNDIGDESVRYLTQLLEGPNSILTELDLHDTRVSDRGVLILSEILQTNTTLVKLDLSYNLGITNNCVEALLRMLDHNQTLTNISLKGCRIYDPESARLRQTTNKITSIEL